LTSQFHVNLLIYLALTTLLVGELLIWSYYQSCMQTWKHFTNFHWEHCLWKGYWFK